eukprot:TRINITY_DN29362_c0_g1_i1.p1 TRINITY_DN29362_c0_g1~~TRINITY_DN29362_c0_g1_i1.p1  ORF type:complete len:441 (+),score=144.52 TRINITY_DN29362_c0_g1_i1:161-1483(+)
MSRKKKDSDEVDFKLKSGTAWSHNYLNQKPWHPLSYPNQRRKWIAEQEESQKMKLQKEVAREFTQEQDFFKTSALLATKEREKLEAMQGVSFMYTKPPGYNPESARAAEMAAEAKQRQQEAAAAAAANGAVEASLGGQAGLAAEPGAALEERRKPRAKDVFGRTIATAEEFPELKNAPKMDTGIVGRAKPFALEIRNVRCSRCGNMGHQSGDRDCPQKDALTEAEMERQRREDPLTKIMAQVVEEPLKWELKHQPGGGSPPRGGFGSDDPNQQILAGDEYVLLENGGLRENEDDDAIIPPDVLASLTKKQRKELKAAYRLKRKEEKKDKKRKRHKADSKHRVEKEEKKGKKDKEKRKRKRQKREASGKKDKEVSTDDSSDEEDEDTEEEEVNERQQSKEGSRQRRSSKGEHDGAERKQGEEREEGQGEKKEEASEARGEW